MTKYLSILVALMVTMFAANSFAFTPPSAPSNGWYVSDGTGRLTAVQIGALNDKINRISKATNNELGIAFVQSLDGATIEHVSYKTFRAWGIGKHGLDNGVLIMLALKEHKTRIETGKGVGGEITDIQAKQILDDLRPQLRTGNFFGAFNQALDGVSGLLDSRANAKFTPAPPPAAPQQVAPPAEAQPTVQQTSSGMGGFGIFLLILLGLGLVGVVLYFIFRDNDDDDENIRYTGSSYTPPAPTVHNYWSPGMPRASAPLTSSYVAPTPVYVQDNSLATAVVTGALIAEEVREERREEREERREERREEESSYVAPKTSSWDDSSSSSSSSDSTPSYDPGPSSSDSGGGFGGGDSGGGGASSDW